MNSQRIAWIVLFGLLCSLASSSGQPLFRFKSAMSVEDFERCGLHKLSPDELTALETWLTPTQHPPV